MVGKKCKKTTLAVAISLCLMPLASHSHEFHQLSDKLPDFFESVLNFAEDDIETDVEDDIEDDVEDDIEDDVEGDIEDDIEDDVEDDIEDDVESDIEDEVESDIEDSVEEDIEEDVEDDIEDDVENDIEDNVEDDIEDYVEDDIENEAENDIEDDADIREFTSLDAQLSQLIEDQIDLHVDYNNYRTLTNDWLILTAEDEDFFVSEGFRVKRTEPIRSLNKQLIRVEAPASFEFDNNGKSLITQFNSSTRVVDVNHVYGLANDLPITTKAKESKSPHQILALPKPKSVPRIGIIDTKINLQHPSLKNAAILQRSFEEQLSNTLTNPHGTAIAAILVGQASNYRGLFENAELYSSSVFFELQNQTSISTVESLIRALDWQVQQGVNVINLSLAGPPNALLQSVIEDYCNQNINIVAAVGNHGPNAPAMYPAAYDCVIGVTAINANNRIYRRAVRGQHVDVSAYGVNVYTATNGYAFDHVSGTSFAAPFVSAYVLAKMESGKVTNPFELNGIFNELMDLGAPGKDEIYGAGALPFGYTLSP